MKLPVRFLFSFLLFFLIFFGLFTKSIHAQSINQTPQNSYAVPNTNPDVPKNLHTYTQSVMIEVMSALTCQLAGVDPTNPTGKCLGVDPKTGSIGFVEGGGGAVGVMGNFIGMLYRPPAHTVDYAANLAQNFGISKHTYAANNGTGFAGISPLIDLWSQFRNIVYLLFVLVFIIIGVAIMLRIKIDPRTVMTIQNQIPKLIIGILLVTFSFAIAGFLIDVMYIFIYLIINILYSHQGTPSLYTSSFGFANNTFGIFDIAFKASYSISAIILDFSPKLFTTYLGSIITSVLGFVLAGPIGAATGSTCAILESIPRVGGFLANFFNFLTGGFLSHIIGIGGGACDLTNYAGKIIVGGLAGIIAFLVILIAILWALFRLWFTLLSAYIMILIDIVLAPFWIVAGAFPGSAVSFTGWLRSLVANLSVFPATIALFLLGARFMEIFSAHPGDMFVPPLIGNSDAADHFGAIIGLGIILTTPNIVKTMREALKAPKVDLSSIGSAIGVGAGVPTRTVGQAAGIYTAATFNPYDASGSRRAALGRVLTRFLR